MVHFEFGQDRLTQPHPLPTLCLTRPSWNAYSCSVRVPQRWPRIRCIRYENHQP